MKCEEQLMPWDDRRDSWRDRPDFPTLEQVERASHEDLVRWSRFLAVGDTPEQKKIMKRIQQRFKEKGGMTPTVSDKIGY
jgi:hypothetical protein